MSLLWRDRLQIVLTPGRLLLVRLGKGLSTRVLDKESIPCPPAEAGAPPWQPALAALLSALEDRRWKRAEARIILSNHLVHYLLVPWQEKVAGEEEQLALIRYSFSEVYGEAAGNWEVIWNEGRPPAPSLACAVDQGLLAGLREAVAAAGLSLGGIQPYLPAAFNRWRKELNGNRDWFLLAETGRVCLVWFDADDWAGLHCQQVGETWGTDLPGILERALLLSGRDRPPERLSIAAPEMPPGDITLAEGWSGNVLKLPNYPGFSPVSDGAYAMALNT